MTSSTFIKRKSGQIAFRYRATDSATGITRETAKRQAERLGVDETQAIHIALHSLAVRLLPQYEADDGALMAAQFDQIKQQVPQGKNSSARTQMLNVGNELKTRPGRTRRLLSELLDATPQGLCRADGWDEFGGRGGEL